MLYIKTELVTVDEQADDRIVQLGRFRETDGFSRQALESRSER